MDIAYLSVRAEDTAYNDSHLAQLVTESQIMLKEIWERVKMEAGTSEEDAVMVEKSIHSESFIERIVSRSVYMVNMISIKNVDSGFPLHPLCRILQLKLLWRAAW